MTKGDDGADDNLETRADTILDGLNPECSRRSEMGCWL